ncbi:MAG: hypothetical protein GY867_12545, partial [bacterium]|nr:hypothetical protein [bacterium]
EFALGGSVAENLIQNSIKAYVDSGTTVDVEGDVVISADDQSKDKDALDLGYGHGLKTGDAVVYDNNGGTSIDTLNKDGSDGDRLTDGASYYVIVDEFNPAEVRLAATEGDAHDGNALSLKLGESNLGASHSLTRTDTFDPKLDIDDSITPDTITFAARHSFETGVAVEYDNNGNSSLAINGGALTQGETYYVIRVGDTQIQLAQSSEDAYDSKAIDIADTSSLPEGATHKLIRQATFDPETDFHRTGVIGIAGGIAWAKETGVGAAIITNNIVNEVNATVDNAIITTVGGAVNIESLTNAHL